MASLALHSTVTAFGRLSVSCDGSAQRSQVRSSAVSTRCGALKSGSLMCTSRRLSSTSSYAEILQVTRPRPAATSRTSTITMMAPTDKKVVKKKIDSAVKRATQSEKRRIYNKSRKSEIATRMKKVFLALDALKASKQPDQSQLEPIEKLIGEAYCIIDKSVKVGTVHKNKGANRKSRLARYKQRVLIALGWYTPTEA